MSGLSERHLLLQGWIRVVAHLINIIIVIIIIITIIVIIIIAIKIISIRSWPQIYKIRTDVFWDCATWRLKSEVPLRAQH